MKAISLFSGVGGFEIGFERAGIETVLQAERDPWALEVLARHWPGTERVTDVRDVTYEGVSALLSREAADRVSQATEGADGTSLVVRGVRECVLPGGRSQEGAARGTASAESAAAVLPERGGLRRDVDGSGRSVRYLREATVESEGGSRPRYGSGEGSALPSVQPAVGGTRGRVLPASGDGVSVVFGGFPCQPFSVAGKRLGESDERDGWPEFRRIVRELRPRWVVAENVPGLLSIAGGRYFGSIIADLVELGYGVAWGIRDAQFFGVPQRRRRLFIVATNIVIGRAGAERCAQVLSLCESCGGNPPPSRTAGEGVAYTLRGGTSGARGINSPQAWNTDLVATPAVAIRTANTGANVHGIAEDVAHTLDGAQGQAVIASALSARMGHHGHSSPRGDGADNLIPEIAWALQERDAKGPDSSTKDGHLLPSSAGVRRLTPRECERLMGWPDDHTRWTADGREISDSHRYRLCGNGVVAPVAEWIGHRLVAVDALMRRAA